MNAAAAPDHSTDWYVDRLLEDSERFAAILDAERHDIPVAGCPGWDLRRLAQHLGQIHRWARFCVLHPEGPPSDEEAAALESFQPDRAAAWLREGAERLGTALRSIDPDAPAWHPFPVPRVAQVWPRRQAHETALHRWDAEHAAGHDAIIDADLASDGIDEYFEIVVPRRIVRDGVTLPAGSLHVHCTDVEGEWLVWAEAGELHMIRAHQKGDAALRGPAGPLLLRLWGRTPDRHAAIDVVGDASVVDAWLDIAGM